jgi:LDH2 family malate/lactate/ureidoglycolate dehydrogenase
VSGGENNTIRVEVPKLYSFTRRAFQATGVSEEDAKTAAEMLVNTEKRGVITHGLARLVPWYIRPLINGVYAKSPEIKIVSETDSCAHLDADGGLGFVIGKKAMDIAIQKAEKTGVGLVSTHNVGHFGAALNYPLLASRRGLIGFCCTNTPPWMAAPGTGTAAIGTNPLAFAAPAGDKDDFLLDMSCTVVAAAKALREDIKIPEGWAVDKEGNPVTKQNRIGMGKSALLPLGTDPAHGAFKGYGLGIMVEILTAMLTGTSFGKLHSEQGGKTWCSFFGAIRINAFVPPEVFKVKMDEMITGLENLPGKFSGVDRLYVPGGHGAEIAKDREKNGIPLSAAIIEEHRKLAGELGIAIDY